MLFAQFFTRSTGYVPGTIPPRFDGPRELIEACGDRGVLIVDARVRVITASALARDHAKRYGFEAFQLHRGATFTRSKPCGNVAHVPVEAAADNGYAAAKARAEETIYDLHH